MANESGAARQIDPERGTRFNWGRNRPPQLEKIIRAIEKQARSLGYIENRRMIATIAMRVAPEEYKTLEIADEVMRFILQQGMCIEEMATKHCYPDAMRNIEIFVALRSGQRVEDPGSPAVRLEKVQKNICSKRRKGRNKVDVQPIVVRAAPEQKAIERTMVVTDATTAAAEPTLHETLRQLQEHYGWPIVDRLPTIVMRAVSGALHPHYANQSTAPSHWRSKGLLSNLGTVRQATAIWEVNSIACTCDWQDATTTKALTSGEVFDLLKMLFEGQGKILAQAIDDVRESIRRWPTVTVPEQPRTVSVKKETFAKQEEPACPAPRNVPSDLEAIEAQLRELMALRKPLRLAERKARQREQEQARLQTQIEAIVAEVRQLGEEEKRHAEAAATLRKEREEKERVLQQCRERLKEPVPA